MEKEKDIFNHIVPSSKPNVPEGYFNTLQKELNARIDTKPKRQKSGLVVTMYSLASVAAVLLMYFSIININNFSENTANLANIETQDLDIYIEANIENFDDDVFIEAGYIAVNEKTHNLNFEEKISTIELEEISDYLLDDEEFEIDEY